MRDFVAKTCFFGALLISFPGFSQQQLVLEKINHDKKIIIQEGDKARVYFKADSVLRKKYRPFGYRKKDKTISYAQGRIIEYTENGFKLVPNNQFTRKLFKRKIDTLTVELNQILAFNKVNGFKLFGTSMLANGLIRGGAIIVYTVTGSFWIFMGTNITGIIFSPLARKYIRETATPLKKVPRRLKKWDLYFDDPVALK